MELPGGDITFYAEQVSHHPQITRFLMEHKEGLFKQYGWYEMKGTLNGLNSLRGWKDGKNTLEFHDGAKYEFTHPTLIIDNLITGQKYQYFRGKSSITDVQNNIVAEFHFNPYIDEKKKKSFSWGGLASKLGGGKKKKEAEAAPKPKRADDFTVSVFKTKVEEEEQKTKKKKAQTEEREVLFSGEGGWLSHLILDGEVVWKIGDDLG
jgi:hypothetical protein